MGRNVGRSRGMKELARIQAAWDRAVDTGLMPDGNEVNYRALPTGDVLSDSIGSDGQLLVDGRELTPEWAAELRHMKPIFAGLINEFEKASQSWVRISEMGPCKHSTRTRAGRH